MYPVLRPRNYCPRTPSRHKQTSSDALQVFCRVRPTCTNDSESCVAIISDSMIQLTVPENSINYKSGVTAKYNYSFQKVFGDSCSQREVFDDVALPLVERLIKGSNGLLFTYGVTGSGKTYTMTGVKDNIGIMPRCLDVLFNSIFDCQASKFVFKPDRMNGFEVQSESAAKKDLEDSLKKASRTYKLRKNQSQEDLISARSNDGFKITDVQQDNAYAVFVTYIEIYNDNVFDLLENINETDVYTKLQSKIIREDANQNGYAHGVTEVEVKSADEAFEVFLKGKKRKRMAQTTLNTESSRSHSIFTIRLVQAPLDFDGVEVDQRKENICVSQLSLVDLAGSERTSRTNNRGDRAREAGSINNSLMTLRTCLEILRENQKTASTKMIPCRDSKLTRLFRIFFEGKGDIRMIVCVNPRKEDYDETIQVMRFAETSQEILLKPTITKPTPLRSEGRRRGLAFRKAIPSIEELRDREPIAYVPNDVEVIYSFEPFPSMENTDPFDSDYNKNLLNFLENRMKKKTELVADIMLRSDKFRVAFVDREEKFLNQQRDLDAVNARLECELVKTKNLEEKVISLDSNVNAFKRKCDEYHNDVRRLKIENEHKNQIIQQYTADKDREKRSNRKLVAKSEKLVKEKENTLKEKEQAQQQLKETNKALNRVRKVLEVRDENAIAKLDDFETDTDSPLTSSSNDIPPKTPIVSLVSVISPKSISTLSNHVRYNKQCEAHDEWLDHRTTHMAPTSTVLQPQLKRRKSFTTATSPKELNKSSKYCLTTQNVNEDGAIRTQLFKGNVIPTCSGGGVQVILNDVEVLEQKSPISSPVTSPKRVKTGSSNITVAESAAGCSSYLDVAARCAVSLEGHSIKKK